ncbi:MAG: DUF452 family protein [Cyanobacteria bacterium SIG28]|nr:DUF452 family protein [Cyanobacteria bacterium SIG28]
MKYKWLNRAENKKIILFFNGWGMDENTVCHLNPESYDILMFYDYNNLETNFEIKSLGIYNEINLVAWSMGVMVAGIDSLFTNQIKFTHKTAVNGTLKPIDDNFGINPRIYDLTIRGFNECSCEKFIQNMFTKPQKIINNRDLENQKRELIALKTYKADEKFEYNKVFISEQDKIMPTKSQIKYWNIEANLPDGHYPFFNFTKWSELL